MSSSLPKAPAPCQAPDPDEIPDVIPDFLPGGGITLLAGAPNVGKTAVMSTILRAIRNGQPVFGHQPRPVAIGAIAGDRGWRKGAGIWFTRAGFAEIPHYAMVDDRSFNPKRLRKKFERTDLLASFIDKLQLPPESLIYVDPISLFLGGNLLDYDTCASACHDIRAYLRDRRYTILATAHSAKLKADKKERYMRPQDQVLGSTAISGFSDSMLYLASPQETNMPYYTLIWHPHTAKEEQYLLERDDQGLFVPYTGIFGDRFQNPVEQQIFLLIPADGSVVEFGTVVDLAEAIPASRSTVKRTLDQLAKAEVITRVGHGQYRRVVLQ